MLVVVDSVQLDDIKLVEASRQAISIGISTFKGRHAQVQGPACTFYSVRHNIVEVAESHLTEALKETRALHLGSIELTILPPQATWVSCNIWNL
jgi:hypothetical protein